jgi:hypothetical protein
VSEAGRHRKPESGYPVEQAPGGAAAAPAVVPASAPPLRSPWRRGRDYVAVASLVVACLVAGVAVWTFSDARATTLTTAEPAAPLPPAPEDVPGTLTEIWRAPSPATPVPVSESAAVVTGNGGDVVGRDPLTGEERWRYSRELPLCTIGGEWGTALALHRKGEWCSEVTQFDPATGSRTAQRNGNAELGTRLVSDGSHVTTTGDRLLNTWRNDLVRSMEYGTVPALVNAGKQPRTGCTFGTVAAADDKVGVIEQCPQDPADRLTVYKATGEDSDEPEVVFSVVLPGRSAKLVALTGDAAAVALPQRKQLVLYGPEGDQRQAYPLDLPPADLAADPPGGVVPTGSGRSGIYWFTGSRTVALGRTDLTPRWTVSGTLGPGVLFAGQLVVPIPGGVAVLDEATGKTIRTVAVHRQGYEGPVRLGVAGPMLLEQRGDTLVALR